MASTVIAESNPDQEQCSINHDGSQTCTKVVQNNDTTSIGTSNDTKASNDVSMEGDKSEHCEIWAYRDECKVNPKYMNLNCPTSCKKMADSTYRQLKDLNDDCHRFAKLGECDVNPRYMREFCAKSCREYENEMLNHKSMKKKFTDEEKRLNNIHTDQCQLYMAESSIPNSGLGMFTAVPINEGALVFHPEIIVSYFDNGVHAERNLIYKQLQSKDSKWTEWKEIIADKVDNDAMCSSWALKDEECEKNPNYMLKNCQRSCAIHESGILRDFDYEHNWLPTNYYWDASEFKGFFAIFAPFSSQ